MLIAATFTIDFQKSWDSLITKTGLTTSSAIMTWLGFAGAGMVVFALVRYLLDRRKGQRGNHMALIMTAIVGALLYDPIDIIHWMLGIFDAAVNIVIKAFGG